MNIKNIRLHTILFFIFVLTCFSPSFAQDGKMYPMEAPAESNAIPLNTGGVKNQPEKETWFKQWGDPMARNISHATLTPFLADPKIATGTSVIVAPGGAFMWLSMGNEGWEVATALQARGINAFVLKYRVQPTKGSLEGFAKQMQERFAAAESDSSATNSPQWDISNPQEDAAAAYALINRRAKEWHVDKSKLGMIGFSAGAELTLQTALATDKIDLAFAGLIYGMMRKVDVPKSAPPLFAAIATDDFLFNGQFGLIQSWYNAGIPVEFHLYQNGGHGFGLGNPDRTSNTWFDAFIHWLEVNKLTTPVR